MLRYPTVLLVGRNERVLQVAKYHHIIKINITIIISIGKDRRVGLGTFFC